MSKYDFARRLKCIVKEQCEIFKTEKKVVQKSLKYYEQLSFLETILAKGDAELKIYHKAVEKLKYENDKLEKYKEREEERVCGLMQTVERMQEEYIQIQKQQIELRRLALLKMDCTRNIKLATQSYINLHTLPELIQGVIISEKNTSSEWTPFCLDPSKHTQQQVQDKIWEDDKIDSFFNKTWETLIFGESSYDERKCEEMETQNEINSSEPSESV